MNGGRDDTLPEGDLGGLSAGIALKMKTGAFTGDWRTHV
jgi:hypothetical protein